MELGRTRAKVGKYGVIRKMRLVQCRADSVKHATSPSRRDRSRRVIMSPVINFSPPQPNTEMSGAATPRTSVRLVQSGGTSFNPSAGFAFLAAASVRCTFPSIKAHVALREIWTQDSRSHIAMSHEPSIAWKASLRAHRRRSARPSRVLKPRWS